MFDTLSKAGKYLGQAAKMMIGVPDYDNYVEHMRITHPDQTPMTYEEFFRERQDARYGGKGGAKCCWQKLFYAVSPCASCCLMPS